MSVIRYLPLLRFVWQAAQDARSTATEERPPGDPRVFFAAERTVLAWIRTSLALMVFGFVIERSGLLIKLLLAGQQQTLGNDLSLWVGALFVALGAIAALLGAQQYRGVLKTLDPVDIPPGYPTHRAFYFSAVVAAVGLALTVYLLVTG